MLPLVPSMRYLALGCSLLLIGPVPADEPAPAVMPGGDALPPRAVKRLGRSQFRHGSRILCLAYSPNGQILAAGGGHDPVRLWDAKTGAELRTCAEPWVYAIAFSPRGTVLATGGAHKTIRLWETATGKETRDGKLDGHAAPVKALVLSPDGSMLASGGIDGQVILWDLLTRKATEIKPAAHQDEVTALAFSPESDLLASGSNDRTVRVWSIDDNKTLHTLDAGCGVLAIAFAADGETLFTAGDDHLIRAWDLDTGKVKATLRGHDGFVVSLIVTRDGKHLISGGRDGTIRVWDLTGEAIVEVKKIVRDLGDSDALALSKDGKFLATAGVNQTIRVYETDGGTELTATRLPQAPLTGLALSRDGKHLATADTTGRLYLWDAPGGKLRRAWPGGQRGDVPHAFAPAGDVLATGGAAVRLWDRDTGRQTGDLPRRDGDHVLALAYSPDGKHLAVGHHGRRAELWNVARKQVVRSLKHAGPVSAISFSRDGSQVALGGGSTISVYDAATGNSLKQLASSAKAGIVPTVASLAFAPDGKQLVVGCYDGLIRIFDLAAGVEARVCAGHVGVPYAVALSSDGRMLASAGFDKTVGLWETFSGRPIAVFPGHRGPVVGVAFAPDDRTVYSAGSDTEVFVWQVPAPEAVFDIPASLLKPPDLDAAWHTIASDDAAKAHQAVWRLIAAADVSVPYLGKKLCLIDPARVDVLFKDLNSENYEQRAAAMKELADYGMWMKGRLQDAVGQPGSLEVKRRLEQLLQKLAVPGAVSLEQERLRLHRVMLILEHVGGPEAQQLFTKLAAQAPEKPFQDDARASLDRLAERAGR